MLVAHLIQIFVVSCFLEHDVELFYATEEHFGSLYRFNALFDGLFCQFKNVSIEGVVDDEDFHFEFGCFGGLDRGFIVEVPRAFGVIGRIM